MSSLNDILRLFEVPVSLPRAIKLNFRDITRIGKVNEIYHMIEELSLNNNHISNL